MISKASLICVIVLASSYAWSQRTSGSRPTAQPSTPVIDQGARYGIGVPAMPTSTRNPFSHRAEEEQKVEFSSTTVLVQVPVVVTDKAGAHIHNLTKENFQIFENGKEQKVGTFEEITAAHVPLPAPVTKPGEFSNLAVDPTQRRTLAIIAIDSINTPYLDQAYGRQQLIKYLSQNLEPGQTLGLVLIGGKGVRLLQGLTSDPAQLIAAVKKVSGEIPAMQGYDTEAQVAAVGGALNTPSANVSPLGGFAGNSDAIPQIDIAGELRDFVLKGDAISGAFQQDHAIEMTLRAFLNIATYVSGIPGRKALIWATGSFPFTIESPSTVPGGDLSLLYERTMATLNQSETSVYPVDIRGLVANAPTADATYAGGRLGPQMTNAVVGRSWLQASSLDTLKDFAAMTGGRAFYNTNDLAGSFRKAAEDASSYYMLGYYLDTHNDKPGWRSLKVKVNKPEVEIRARNGFFVTNATMNPSITRALDEDFAIKSPFDATSVPLTVRWLDTTLDGDKRRVNFMIAVPNGGILIDEVAQNRFSIDLAALVTNDKGANAGKFEQPLQGNIKPEAMSIVKVQGISYHNMMVLPPGQYMVKMLVRDNLSGKIGSVSAPLTVN
jgi:VWFA-related protein